ncbi:MAG TPA: DNA ligase [Ruminococcaceae bacterium]|nr:DNA ligase [Oscillospiraceae bacterium]
MSKMSEMDATIKELRDIASSVNSIANWLAEQFSGNEPELEAAPVEPVLTLEQVRAVFADKSRAGFTAQIRSLLQKHGAAKLSEIDPSHYADLLKEAEGLENG